MPRSADMERMTHNPSTSKSTQVEEPTRRDFLDLAAIAFVGVGAAVASWPLIDQMNPDASVLAAGGPVDLDVSKIKPGQQVVVQWRAKPILSSIDRPKLQFDNSRIVSLTELPKKS